MRRLFDHDMVAYNKHQNGITFMVLTIHSHFVGSSREECIRSVKGKATLEMRVNDTTVYMGAIEYSVVMLHS